LPNHCTAFIQDDQPNLQREIYQTLSEPVNIREPENSSPQLLGRSFRLVNMNLHIILIGKEPIDLNLGLPGGFSEQTM
jgi:hypothetical protein